jgi:tetratricopeptide (TPR) repeat protein
MILLTAYQYHNRTAAGRDTPEMEGQTVPAMPRGEPMTVVSAAVEPSGAPEEVSPPGATGLPPTAGAQVARKQEETKKKAIELFNNKNYEGALKFFRRVEDPDREVLVGTGVCYFKLGDCRSAVSSMKRVLEQDQNDFAALKVLAFAYYDLDNIEESFGNARKGLSLHEDAELRALYERLVREMTARRGYTEESSSHFRILFDGYEHGGVEREILGLLEDAYRTIGQGLDYFPSEPATVILYADRDFYDTTQAPQWSRGIYDGKIRVPVKGIRLQRPVMRKVLFHEYTHVLVHAIAPSCPLWINEGLAEYFSARYPGKIGQVIPLRNIERSFAGLRGRNVTLAYWESYSAVSSLIEKYGLYRMKAVLKAFGTGKGADAAFEDALGVTYSQFIEGWGKEDGLHGGDFPRLDVCCGAT